METVMRILLGLIVLLNMNALPAYAERGGTFRGGGGRVGPFRDGVGDFRGGGGHFRGGAGGGHFRHDGGHFRHDGGHFGFGFHLGPNWWGPGWGPAWPGFYPYYSPPVIVQPPTDLYVQPQPPESEEPLYWYYCQDPEGYYPYIRKCPQGWMKVVPPVNPPDSAPPENPPDAEE